MGEIKDDLPTSKEKKKMDDAYRKFCKERGISFNYLRRKRNEITRKG